MALGGLNDPLQSAVFILIVIFTPLCILATVFRFIASRIAVGKVGMEDWLAFSALAVFLGYIVCVSITGIYLNGNTLTEIPPQDAVMAEKFIYAANISFPIQQTFAKLSILCLYHRLFGVDRKFAFWIRIIAATQLLYCVATVIASVLICIPVYKYWQPLMEQGRCINVAAFLTGVETANSSIDFAMVALAVIMLRGLQTTFWTKVKLGIIFAMAGVAGIFGFIKIGFSFPIALSDQIVLGAWALVQESFSIFCCCVITYKPLLARSGPFGRLGLKLRAFGSRITFTRVGSSLRDANASDEYLDLQGQGFGGVQFSSEITAQKPQPTYPKARVLRISNQPLGGLGQETRAIRIDKTWAHV